jgi:hypothetical protein
LGDGSTVNRGTPALVAGLSGVAAVAAGGESSYALKHDGTVWAWGLNGNGQLGDGTTSDRSAPVQVSGLSGIVAIAAGGSHAVALAHDGAVWAWGANAFAQLGDATTISRNTPAPVPGLSGVIAIAAGASHALALQQDGTVWAWGANAFGQLGDGTATDRGTPAPVPGLSGVVAIAAGPAHTLALVADGTVWAWGANGAGQLGDGTTKGRNTPAPVQGLSAVVAIAAGAGGNGSLGRSLAVRRDGTVWAWGGGSWVAPGDGTATQPLTPVLVVNEAVNGFLDLNPEVPNEIPPDKLPPFLVATHRTGDLSATTLSADLGGIALPESLASNSGVDPITAGGFNLYVAAAVPSSNAILYFQLDSRNVWRPLTWPMAEFVRGVSNCSQAALIRVNILQNVDLRPYIGTSILAGCGSSPDEMVENARYRTIFTVPQPVGQP